MKSPILFNIFLMLVLTQPFLACKSEAPKEAATPKVEVIDVITTDVPIYEDFVGQVYGMVDIPIRARVHGFLEGIHFTEGRSVTKGQLLYSIDPQPYLAEVAEQKSRLAESKTEMTRSKNELVRYEELIKTRAVSQSDYDATKAQAEAAVSAVEAAQANVTMSEINLGYCKIVSPSDGLIGKTLAKVGEFVGKEPNPVILNTVSDVSDVRVNFFLTESQYLLIAREFLGKSGAKTGEPNSNRNNLELILSDGTKHEFKGKVDFINREVDASTGSMLVQSSFPNPTGLLRPGQYAKVRVLFESAIGALLVPERCLVELQGSYSIFTLGDSNKVVAKQITIGSKFGDLRIVESGLTKSDKIILSGSAGMRSGSVVEPTLVSFESKSL
ncbi:MAG: efflux RND transporter periplasmic adaptor subunit [Flavobacteriales bacterium]|nr:efflux RND transporter periplasmic adaptor subunit [Flavobacteriales bacterium]